MGDTITLTPDVSGIFQRRAELRKRNEEIAEKLRHYTCPRCGRETHFWSTRELPDYCPNCGTEPGRG